MHTPSTTQSTRKYFKTRMRCIFARHAHTAAADRARTSCKFALSGGPASLEVSQVVQEALLVALRLLACGRSHMQYAGVCASNVRVVKVEWLPEQRGAMHTDASLCMFVLTGARPAAVLAGGPPGLQCFWHLACVSNAIASRVTD